MPRNGRFVGLYVVVLMLAFELAARAGAIDTWAGAGSAVCVFDQNATTAGATASNALSGTEEFSYYDSDHGWEVRRGVSGAASAAATGTADQLMHVTASYSAPYGGTWHHAYPDLPVTATASWTGDRVVLQAAPGAALPDSIRLSVGIQFRQANAGANVGSTALRFNDQQLAIGSTGNWNEPKCFFQPAGARAPYWPAVQPIPYGEVDGTPLAVAGFDQFSITSVYPGEWWGPRDYRGVFHFDLSVGKDGISDPFDLILDTTVGGGVMSNGMIARSMDFIASIQDISLPDGRSLSDASLTGYTLSGLVIPGLVPEPSTLLIWGAGTAFCIFCGARRRAPKQPI